MPFTPFHMGAGLAAKAVLDGRISLISFGVAQVLMDLQPGLAMITGQGELHGWTHTVAGALCIGAAATVVSPYLIRPIVVRWNKEVEHYRLSWLTVATVWRRGAVATGALVGTISHVLLDGLIHADMKPMAPFNDLNPLLELVEHDSVYFLCAAAGAISGAAWLLRRWLRRI